MRPFTTEVKIPDYPWKIGYRHRVLGMGSCFTEYVLGKMQSLNFPVLTNPQGILFNPVSIARTLERTINGRSFAEADLIEHQGLWHSFEHHGKFSDPDRETCLRQINTDLAAARQWLLQTDFLILTWGTAYVWERVDTGTVAANCHQLPAAAFHRRRLSLEQTEASLLKVLQQLHEQRPQLQCIITVSPVRHLREGLIENQRSKAILLLAAEALCRRFDFVHYFPAYEIQLDELRSYRYYAPNLTNPSDTAVDYIWERFSNTLVDEASQGIMKKIAGIKRMLAHRPKYPGSSRHLEFLHGALRQVNELAKEFPYISFSADQNRISTQIKKYTKV